MKSVPPRGSGWVRPVKRLVRFTHSLPRCGTDLMHSRLRLARDLFFLRNRPVESAEESEKTPIGSQLFQTRIDANESKAHGMLPFRQ